jgi:hypothetical protein
VRCEWSHIRQGWEVRPASICGPDGGESLRNQFSMDGVMTKAPLGAGEKREIVVSPMVFLLSARATLKSLRDWTEIWLKSPLP